MMKEEILHIKGEDIKKGKIPVDIYKDKEGAFSGMADMMVEAIKENNAKHKRTLFICPLGPIGQYKYFAKRVNEERISLKDVTFINMDEYMLDDKTICGTDYKLSFKKTMYELCYNKIDKDLIMPESQRIFPTLDNADYIDEVIKDHGGVDVCFGGIGITGHMAFNEPPEPGEKVDEEEFVKSRTRVVKISRETRVVNSFDDFDGAYPLVPEYAVTIGLKEILESKKVRLFCFRPWHKFVVRRAAFGECSIDFPASLLQKHPDARIGISEELAE